MKEKIKKRMKGTVSVFLTLILIPSMLLACITTDASRIYAAKTVISDAGELTLNAALAQYDEALFDKYGLLTMAYTPEEMKDGLEAAFVKSLNAQGIEGISGYGDALKLLEQNFEALKVDNSEIYRTEVEKQQIVEYMKYRAPVCLTEMLFEKIGFLKDTKKIKKAMDNQVTFSKSMEKCQDAFKDARESLDKLIALIDSFPSKEEIATSMYDAWEDMRTGVSLGAAMYKATGYQSSPYDCDGTDIESMAEEFIAYAEGINLDNPIEEESYYNYLCAVPYLTEISESDIQELIDAEEPEDQDDYKELKKDFKKAKKKVTGDYGNKLKENTINLIKKRQEILKGYYDQAEKIRNQAEDAIKKLDECERLLKDAAGDFRKWQGSLEELKPEQKDGMQVEIDKYNDLFGDGKTYDSFCQSDMQKLAILRENVIRANSTYYQGIMDRLNEVAFCGKKVKSDSAESQFGAYVDKAGVGSPPQDYDELVLACESVFNREEYKVTFEKVAPDTDPKSVRDDPFYKKLVEYTQPAEKTQEQKEKTKEGNNLLSGAVGAVTAFTDIDCKDYDWSAYNTKKLPSTQLGLASFEQSPDTSKYTSMDQADGIDDSGSRKNAIDKMKDAIDSASSFMDGVDRILTSGIADLYVTEYAMQMFSYYTFNKKMTTDNSTGKYKVETIEKPTTITGYEINEENNKAYRSECEYILWGNKDAKSNIRSTVAVMFGIRMLMNSIYTFTNTEICSITRETAELIAGAAPFLIPVLTVVLRLAIACCETGNDMRDLKEGKGVTIVKNKESFETFPLPNDADNQNGFTFDYGEYLRIFMLLEAFGSESYMLSRVADCIQVNTPDDCDLINRYVMIGIKSDVQVKTVFLSRAENAFSGITNWKDEKGNAITWKSTGWKDKNDYTITYRSLLGY